VVLITASASAATPQTEQTTTTPNAAATQPSQVRVNCQSQAGERQHCTADTRAGVVLVSSKGTAPCLLGKTWGYDDSGIWVSDGCSGEFQAGQGATEAASKEKPLEHINNVGFLLYNGEQGQIYFRLFTYARYLNQRMLDASSTDHLGVTTNVKRRQDAQLQKFFAPFSGWYMTPNFRYYLYVWSANTAQGDPAQVVGAGNISYNFNRFVTFGAGITSLPSTRSTEGNFPYWLGVDDRLIADEFFRGSYTTGFWLKGEITAKLKYMAMIANNLSTLGVSAARLDNTFNTQSYSLVWLPSTGEFGLWGTFGDYDDHEKLATRLAGHYTLSTEDRQSQPGSESIENSQLRLSDGTNIFTPNLFGPGVDVEIVNYQMVSIDGGLKKHGRSFEAEYFWRRLSDFGGDNISGIPVIRDQGYQVQASAMLVQKVLQAYVSNSKIFGDFGDPWDVHAGVNWYFRKERGLRVNGELFYVRHSPVGYTAYPVPVGADGPVVHLNLEMNF
jgi:Protein of unknown function (DUF3011)